MHHYRQLLYRTYSLVDPAHITEMEVSHPKEAAH